MKNVQQQQINVPSVSLIIIQKMKDVTCVQQNIAQHAVRRQENVQHVKMDIIFPTTKWNACHVLIRFQIVSFVYQQQNARHVVMISIQQRMELNARHVSRNIAQNVTHQQDIAVHARLDILSILRQNNVRNVPIKLVTVDYVQVETNVTHVRMDIIQMEVDVHYVNQNIAQHVMHRMENVQHVKQDTIWIQVTNNVNCVPTRCQDVIYVNPERSVRNVMKIISKRI